MPNRSRNPLEGALFTLLRPLVRLALERGLACGEMVAVLKRAYVDVAQRDFIVEGRKQTASRISLLTGLTRKEVGRMLSVQDPENAWRDRSRVNRAARVLSAWARDPDFLDGRGAPASLPFEVEKGPSFTGLVRRHGADVTARAVLDELVRVGAVGRLKDGRIRPLDRAYVPHSDESEKLAILGTDVADLIAAIDHNIMRPDQEPFYQRKVAYDNLPADYLPKLRALVRRDAQKLLERFDTEMARHDRDVAPDAESPGAKRAMIGIYYFEDDRDEDDQDND
ncbi:MAG: hypothetical protein JRH17_10090 [Deltaproteobacteria bacterium]|nr:hypothetical protein [Deltaproteobacteria bacterium]